MQLRRNRVVLQLVDQPIERRRIEPRSQFASVRNDPVRGNVGVRQARSEPASDGIVQDLLERSPLTMDLICQQARDILIEREGRSHEDIMMPYMISVKMPTPPAGPDGPKRPRLGERARLRRASLAGARGAKGA